MTRILMVDDSMTFRKRMAHKLEGHGMEVVQASDGLEGLKKIEDEGDSIDFIICDLNMGVMNGLQMCANLQEQGNTIPIVMLTTDSSMSMKEEGKKVGVKGWITKTNLSSDTELMVMAIEKILGDK